MVSALLIIFNLFVLEILLSLDNAAVLAIMVKDLPIRDRSRALRYGILGAFLFRGLSLFIVSFIIRIVWLKVIGGLYLIYLVYGHFASKSEAIEEPRATKDSHIYKIGSRIGLSRLWATVVLVEMMDMAFSIDNIFASVAITSNMIFIIIGVFWGIITMRFVAKLLSSLIMKYSSLENSAFIVIGLLGGRLIFFGIFNPLTNHIFDMSFSALIFIIFFFPILSKRVCLQKKRKLSNH